MPGAVADPRDHSGIAEFCATLPPLLETVAPKVLLEATFALCKDRPPVSASAATEIEDPRLHNGRSAEGCMRMVEPKVLVPGT